MTSRADRAGRAAWRSVAAAIALAVAGGAVSLRGAEVLDRVIAVVSGTVITLSDARAALALGFVESKPGADPVETAMHWLVDRQVVLDEAARSGGAEGDQASVQHEMDAIRQRFASDGEYGAALTRLGLDAGSAAALVRGNLAARQYVERRFEAVFPASDEELREFFASRQDRFVRNGRQLTFEEAAEDVAAMVQKERREQAISTWMERLRRRADVTELYRTTR
jgi:parvulin-like peptidyl-prolyl isomerase